MRCEVCGASPVERVLFAPAVHFKGSGFYSTDYGRGKKRDTSKDGDGGSADKKPATEDDRQEDPVVDAVLVGRGLGGGSSSSGRAARTAPGRARLTSRQ